MSKLRNYHGNYGGKSMRCTWYSLRVHVNHELHNWHISRRRVTFIMNLALKR